jgi:hypothetical protein
MRNRKSVAVVSGLAALLALSSVVPAFSSDSSNGGRGGGDSISARITRIQAQIGKDGQKIKPVLIQILDNLKKFEAKGSLSATIKDLDHRGLREDISASKYELQAKCVDESGKERSASTLKTNVGNDPNAVHPPICINVRKLALENAQSNELAGLLFHEHARHFGIDDTGEFEIHPIAQFVSERYSLLTSPDLTGAKSLIPGLAAFVGERYWEPGEHSKSLLKVFTSSVGHVPVRVESTQGKCVDGKVFILAWGDEKNERCYWEVNCFSEARGRSVYDVPITGGNPQAFSGTLQSAKDPAVATGNSTVPAPSERSGNGK